MPSFWLPLCILFPLAAGAALFALPDRSFRLLFGTTLAVTTVTSALVWAWILWGGEAAIALIRFAPELELLLKTDGLGRFFLGVLATLWPLTVLYAGSYMRDQQHVRSFFAFFTLAYCAAIGVAAAGNLFTLYCFYEFLTLSTVPLILQPMTSAARKAAREYFLYSIGGSAFAFVAMLYLLAHGASGPFTPGGILRGEVFGGEGIARLFWLFGFLGFSVKAALFPLHRWLIKASVAPTPVTALLHAVAVVKSGAFAVIRLTQYCYGTELLAGSWAQTAALLLTAFTVVYGSSLAVRETHFKRRLAYSTVANLSYILFGAMLMTPAGLTAGMSHFIFHGVIKITLFFCAGAVITANGREYMYQMNGLGTRMPRTFAAFTIGALALTGIPLLPGFVSKMNLIGAAADAGRGIWAYAGIGALLASALLTAAYLILPSVTGIPAGGCWRCLRCCAPR